MSFRDARATAPNCRNGDDPAAETGQRQERSRHRAMSFDDAGSILKEARLTSEPGLGRS
jgi:hypothetical protein